METLIPLRFKNKGMTVVTDNYYNTGESLTKFHEQNTSVVCTMRENRVGKIMGKEITKRLAAKVPKRHFQRKIEIYEQKW